jgi:predicted nucleic acid-binding protein
MIVPGMIVLDTNVVSEPLKMQPDPKVLAWLDAQAAETLYTTTISYSELRFGVLKMPEGNRKNSLAAQIERVLDLFKDRMLEFNVKAAEQLAQIGARCEKIGKPATAPDAYIAAIAAANGFSVATRNVDHFKHTGVAVINPWG